MYFSGPEDAKGTEEIVESTLDRYENVLFLFMDYDKLRGTLCDGQKINRNTSLLKDVYTI